MVLGAHVLHAYHGHSRRLYVTEQSDSQRYDGQGHTNTSASVGHPPRHADVVCVRWTSEDRMILVNMR